MLMQLSEDGRDRVTTRMCVAGNESFVKDVGGG